MKADLHVHTGFSCDSEETIEAYLKQAVEQGMEMICFTDHVDFNPVDYGYLYYKPDLFFEKLHGVRAVCPQGLKLYAGIEFGEPHLYGEELERLSGYPYDLVIGSIHWIGSTFPSQVKRDPQEMREFCSLYWQELERTVRHGGFDVLGHVDFPKRYLGEIYYAEARVRDIFKELLDQDKILEINTSSLRKGLTEVMPGKAFLEMYKECGGTYVTIGSDAHVAEDLGADRETAQKLLQEFGFREVVYVGRKRIVVPV